MCWTSAGCDCFRTVSALHMGGSPGRRVTYGLGRAAISSNVLTSGEAAGSFGAYGRRSPRGLWDLPVARSAKLSGGAKSAALIREKWSSVSLDGVGRVFRAAGGGMGFRGLPDMADPERGAR